MVANTVARLSVLSVGAVTAAVNADTACGFSSPQVMAHPTVVGEAGGPGSVTLTVDDGSTAVEVAVKIALQTWQHRGAPKKTRFRPERTPLMIAFLKAAVDELDCLAAD